MCLIHTHICIHNLYIDICMCLFIHRHICIVHTLICAHTSCVCEELHACNSACTPLYTYLAPVYTHHTSMPIHACIHIDHTYIHACIHIHIHYKYINTYIHTHTYILSAEHSMHTSIWIFHIAACWNQPPISQGSATYMWYFRRSHMHASLAGSCTHFIMPDIASTRNHLFGIPKLYANKYFSWKQSNLKKKYFQIFQIFYGVYAHGSHITYRIRICTGAGGGPHCDNIKAARNSSAGHSWSNTTAVWYVSCVHTYTWLHSFACA